MAVNQEVIEGSWTEVKGKLKERWGQLADDELEQARGNAEQLVGLVLRKTGETREDVENYLEEAAVDGMSVAERTKDAVAGHAQQVAETAQEAGQRASDLARGGYIQTERLIRNRPVESLATCFGVGLITGVVVGLLVRGR